AGKCFDRARQLISERLDAFGLERREWQHWYRKAAQILTRKHRRQIVLVEHGHASAAAAELDHPQNSGLERPRRIEHGEHQLGLGGVLERPFNPDSLDLPYLIRSCAAVTPHTVTNPGCILKDERIS